MPNGTEGGGAASGEGQQPESRLDREMVRWTRGVAIFTFLLFITSAIANWFTWQDWRGARKAEERNIEQLRAVVRVSGTIVTPGVDLQGNKTAGFITTFQNFGSTRTARFRAWQSVQYFDSDVPNNFDPTKPNMKLDLADSTLGPNNSQSLAPAGLPYDQFEKALAQKGNLIIWGQAIYSDIYSPNVDRHVSFCQTIHVEKITPKLAKKGGVPVAEQIAVQATPYRNDCNKSE